MKKKIVITISRQYGSGGREIGQALSERLNIPFYDKDLIMLAAKESRFDENLFKNEDQEKKNPFSYLLSIYSNAMSHYDLSLNDQVFLIQTKVIREVAKNSCVIIGRVADYILRNEENLFRIYIHAPLDDRIKRSIDEYHDDPDEVSDKINRIDKNRATYYNYYANAKWGNISNYDLTLNSSLLGIEGCIDVIEQAVKLIDNQ